jgi:hemolysin activation/secretion protein
MTAGYRDAGYLLAQVVVPPQRIVDGRPQLNAVEGYVADVRVEGELDRPALFDAARSDLLAERPLRTETLERFMLLLNDLPGVTAQGVLQPAGAPGASDLLVRISESHVEATAGVNNRGSQVQGPVLYEAGLELDSVFGLNERTNLRYIRASDPDELRLFALSHSQRLSAQGLELTIAGSRSYADPDLGEEFAQFNLETDTTQGRLELSFPVTRTRAQNLRIRGALTYHDGLTDSLDAPLTDDTIAAVRAGLTWDGVDALGGVNVLDVELSKGIDAFGASEFGDPAASRPGGDPDFSKATLYLARLQSLGTRVSLLLALHGQQAFSNLLAPEEFAFGGDQFGRAYDPSEIVGDSGVAAKAELRLTFDNPSGLSATLYAFSDAGHVWRRLDSAEAGEEDEDDATSAGGGIRVTMAEWLSGYVEVATPLNHIVAAEGDESTRVFGGVLVNFRF